MPSGCFFITKIERYIKKQSILFNISIWYYNFIKKLYEIAKERKQKWEVSFMKKKLVLAMAATMAITSCAVPVLAPNIQFSWNNLYPTLFPHQAPLK